MRILTNVLFFLFLIPSGCRQQVHTELNSSTPIVYYDIILRGGMLYDGSGSEPIVGDIAIHTDTIAAIGSLVNARGRTEYDVRGLAVAPGFINMLSWGERTLLLDGSGMSDIKQGVTLEVFGEGWSPAPMRRTRKNVDSLWSTLDQYFTWLLHKGISPNVASFVGATTVRVHEIDQENRRPTKSELERMQKLVREAMEDGAMGLGSSLIYAPADYASTEELIALAQAASEYGGMYTTHMRSESDHILIALRETFRIAKEADIATEIYHLKINHARNWNKIDTVLRLIDSARNAGLRITANMYPYTASATGLVARVPNWAQAGGAVQMRKRFKNQTTRKKILYEMREGFPIKNSDPSDVMIIGFRKDSLNTLYKGKRLDEIARLHGKDADETVLDLLYADRSTIASVYFLISEDNMKRMLQLPYVSLGSDAGTLTITDVFQDWGAHPRAYGTFAKFVGPLVRDEKLITLQEAIRRITSLPAQNLQLQRRGMLTPGFYADVVVFDPKTIQDHATFEQPHQYATGMLHVFINGTAVLLEGDHTGAKPGRILRGPGWRGNTLP